MLKRRGSVLLQPALNSFHPAWDESVQRGGGEGISVGVLGEAINVGAIGLALINKTEAVGDHNMPRPRGVGQLQVYLNLARFCDDTHILPVLQAELFCVRRVHCQGAHV